MRYLMAKIADFIRESDKILLLLCLFTSLYGCVAVFSATHYLENYRPVIVQLIGTVGGVAVALIISAYDYEKGDEYGIGEVQERARFYRDCESMGVGISVMKPFGGGQLLDAKLSPFKQALTKNQCIQYALDRPAVMTVLPGIRNMQDLEEILSYAKATAEERDYSVIGNFTPQKAYGTCVYCNHCQPCPAGLNVGLINKYYDLAKAGDIMAVGHYQKLNRHADDCIKCGHCEARCPFHVKQETRMEEIAVYFKQCDK